MRGTAVDVVLDVGFFHDWMGRLARSIEENCDELTRLDAAIGDADHGINMLRGMRAAIEALSSEAPKDPAGVFRVTGSRLVAVVGGAAGPLYGSAFRAAAEALGPKPEITVPELARALRAGVKAVQRIGAAEPGDKTMVDAWLPAVEALESAASGSVRSAAAPARGHVGDHPYGATRAPRIWGGAARSSGWGQPPRLLRRSRRHLLTQVEAMHVMRGRQGKQRPRHSIIWADDPVGRPPSALSPSRTRAC